MVALECSFGAAACQEAHCGESLGLIVAGILKRFLHVAIEHGVDRSNLAVGINGIAHITDEVAVAEDSLRTAAHKDVTRDRLCRTVVIEHTALVVVEDAVLEMHLRTDEVGNGTLARRVVGDTTVAYHYLAGIGEGHGSTCGYRRALYHLRGAGVGSTDRETVEHGILCAVEDQEVSHIKLIDSLRLGTDSSDIYVGVTHIETRTRVRTGVAAVEMHIARNVDGSGTDTSHYRCGGIIHRSLLHIHIDSGCRRVVLGGDVVEGIC